MRTLLDQVQPSLRQKMRTMAKRGTPNEAKIAQAWLDYHGGETTLTAEEILAADDSAFGPSEAEVEAAWQRFVQGQR